MGNEKSLEHRLVLKWGKTVSRILQVGTVAALVAIVGRVLGTSGVVKIWEIQWPLKAIWVIFLALTVAHVFASVFLVQAVEQLRSVRTIEEQEAAREDLLAEAGSYVSVSVRRLPKSSKLLVQMSLADASTWVAHGGALAVVIAVLPWWWQGGLRWPGWAASLAIALVALALMLVNWLAGGAWAMAVSRMGTSAPTRNRKLGTTALPRMLTGTVGLVVLIGSVAVSGVLIWLARLLILQE